jgi:hypothetical protein
MRRWQGLIAIAVGAGLLLGLAWGGFWRGAAPSATPSRSDAATPSDDVDALRAELAALGAAVAAEREQRTALAAEVAWLRDELEQMALLPPEVEPPLHAPDAPAGAAADAPESIGVFEEARLIEAGISRDEVERLRDRFDRSRMDELYLNDQATREGWLHSVRQRAEIRDLRQGLRDEIGDDNYDLLLYATGMNNRVIVSDVLRASPAMEAGILPGDVLVRYDGRRIFNRFELKIATSEGKAGSTVALDLVRAGEPLRIYAPRGPLGVTMKAEVGPPEATR